MNTSFRRTPLCLALLSGLTLFLVFANGCGKEEAPQAAEPTVTEPTAKEEAPPTPAPAVAQEPAQAPAPEPIPEPAAPPPPVVAVTPVPVPAPTVAAEPAPKTPKDLIIGKWQASEGGGTITLEFKTDGTLLVSGGDAEHQMSMTGSYSWGSDGSLSITMTQNGQTHTEQATIKSIDETSLTLSSPNHDKDITLTRVTG